MTKELKIKIVEAIRKDRENYDSDRQHSVALDIGAGNYSRIMKNDTDKVLSEGKWTRIARQLGVSPREEEEWKTAHTPTYNHIYKQLIMCQTHSLSGLFCDMADIGKTYTAKQYVKENKGAVYIDCSQVKFKQQLVRAIARCFGIEDTGRYAVVYGDLVFYLQSTENKPLIILDEAGDLNYPAFLEIKALWNATDGVVAWYMMGADGLKAKIDRNKANKKVGYAEIFSRMGSRYQRVTPAGGDDRKSFLKKQTADIISVNLPNADINKVYASTQGSLRRVKIEVAKLQRG